MCLKFRLTHSVLLLYSRQYWASTFAWYLCRKTGSRYTAFELCSRCLHFSARCQWPSWVFSGWRRVVPMFLKEVRYLCKAYKLYLPTNRYSTGAHKTVWGTNKWFFNMTRKSYSFKNLGDLSSLAPSPLGIQYCHVLYTAGVVLFFGGSAVTFALLINLSSNWCGLLKKWEQVEGYFGHQKNLKLKFTFISVVCIIFSIGEQNTNNTTRTASHIFPAKWHLSTSLIIYVGMTGEQINYK